MTKIRKKSSSKKRATLGELENEYRSIAATAENFRNELSHQIGRLLNDHQIILGLPVESRFKKWESITDKIDRLSLNLRSILDLSDLVGLRLIFLFKRDLLKASGILSNTFTILQKV